MLAPGAAGCGGSPDGASEASEVVVYTSVDQHFSEPVLRAFEAETGVRVRPAFDVEAAKTTGLVNRLVAEGKRPRADVWWNGEFAQTIYLADRGVLAPYPSAAASGLPAAYIDPDGLWTAFGGRARVLVVNTDLVAEGDYPSSMLDLIAPSSPSVEASQIGLALPMFGTAATQAAALYAAWGPKEARAFYEAVRARGVRLVDGNSVVRDMVADGRLAFGVTDTDDACGALARGAPVKVVIPDQGPGQPGTLIVPNTVALVAGAPHPEAGRAFIDYLLSEETVAGLVDAGWFQVTLRQVPTAAPCLDTSGVRGMDVPLADVAAAMEAAKADMADIFVLP